MFFCCLLSWQVCGLSEAADVAAAEIAPETIDASTAESHDAAHPHLEAASIDHPLRGSSMPPPASPDVPNPASSTPKLAVPHHGSSVSPVAEAPLLGQCILKKLPRESYCDLYGRMLRQTVPSLNQASCRQQWKQLSQKHKDEWVAALARQASPPDVTATTSPFICDDDIPMSDLIVLAAFSGGTNSTQPTALPHPGSSIPCVSSVPPDVLHPGSIATNVDSEAPEVYISLDKDYGELDLIKEFKACSRIRNLRLNSDDRWRLYAKVALMVQRGDFVSCAQATQRLSSLHVDHHKLLRVSRMNSDNMPRSAPAMFRAGRNAGKQLSDDDKRDLMQWITIRATTTMCPTISEVETAIVALRMRQDGTLAADDGCVETLKAMRDFYSSETLWKNFRDWVSTHCPKEDWVRVRTLRKSRTQQEINCFTPKICSDAVSELVSLLKEHGIADQDGVLVSPTRLCVCDEKGFSQRSDTIVRGVVPNALASQARGKTAQCQWTHVTVMSFLPVEVPGELQPHLPVGVVLPTKRIPPGALETWPNSVMLCHDSGSSFMEAHCHFVLHCFILPMRKAHPEGPLVLMMDSGGGSWFHLSTSLALLCHRHGVFLFYLPAYATRALCALDQEPHSRMAALWGLAKQEWTKKQSELVLAAALRIIRCCVEEGLQPCRGKAGWARTGVEAGSRFNLHKLLVDRAAEIFHVLPAVSKKRSASAILLSALDEAAGVTKTKKGWTKPPQLVKTIAENPHEEFLERQVGDLLRTLQARQSIALPSVPLAFGMASVPDVAKTVDLAEEQVAGEDVDDDDEEHEEEEEEDEEEDPEYDLSKPASLVEYIVDHFPASEYNGVSPQEFKKIAIHYVTDLNVRRKKMSLADFFSREAIDNRIFSFKVSRAQWLKTLKASRDHVCPKKVKPNLGSHLD
jgi:hypothetical protein